MNPITAVYRFVTRSIGRKMVLAVLLVHCLLTAFVTWEIVARERALLEEQRLARAEGVANLLASGGAHWVVSADLAGLRELVGSAASVRAVRYAMFLDSSGRVLAHTDEERVGSYLRDRALRGGGDLRLVARTDQTIDVAAPIRVNGDSIGWAWVSISLADLRARERELAISALGFGAGAVLLGLLIALLTARGVTRRLADLAWATDRFRLGEHTVRVTERGTDEVAAAARGVNAMFEAVAEGERSLKEAQRIAQLGSWRYDPDAATLTWTDAVYELFGLDPAGPAPTFEQFLQALPPEDRKRILQLVDERDARQVSSFTLTVTRPDGAQRICWVEARAETSRQSGKRVFVGVCQDITDREAAAAQLRQAQKMEAVGQLTGGLAHDFNNLLAIVIGNLDLLEEELGAGAGRELIEEALGAALRGAELTRQLLAFSRRQPLAPQRIDLNQLISGIATLWRRTVGEAIDVRVELAEDLWPTQADPSQVESAILNLVINARDAMPDGGTLTVETRNETVASAAGGDDDPIGVGDYSVITVSDTGCGMGPEVAARAFEPFFTTKPVGHGTGLGLSMIYGFAKQSGGHVKIYSEPGHGTAVRLYLPRAAEGAERPRRTGETALPRAAGETILLVEDDDGVRRITRRQLTDLGYRVVEAANGPEALVVLAQHPHVDLLFTDIVMPGGMNGIELAARALKSRPGLKLLHATGFSSQAAASQTGLSPDAALLTKPYRKAVLAEKLRQQLDAPEEQVAP